jgi:hypothetical protein
MFTLDLSPTYTVPVTIQVRAEDGTHTAGTIQADLLRMGPNEFEAYHAQIREQNLSDQDVTRHVLKGWADLVDPKGAPISYSAATRDALLAQVTGAATAIARAWHESVMEDVRKNLYPPVADGRAAETVAPTLIG